MRPPLSHPRLAALVRRADASLAASQDQVRRRARARPHPGRRARPRGHPRRAPPQARRDPRQVRFGDAECGTVWRRDARRQARGAERRGDCAWYACARGRRASGKASAHRHRCVVSPSSPSPAQPHLLIRLSPTARRFARHLVQRPLDPRRLDRAFVRLDLLAHQGRLDLVGRLGRPARFGQPDRRRRGLGGRLRPGRRRRRPAAAARAREGARGQGPRGGHRGRGERGGRGGGRRR